MTRKRTIRRLEACLARIPEAAKRFGQAFDRAIEAIESRPEMFPAHDEAQRFVRPARYPIRLIDRWDGREARVVAVAHAKRRPGCWTERE